MKHDLPTDNGELGQLLTESRPRPAEEFSQRLDRAVADGFNSRGAGGQGSRTPAGRLFRRLIPGRRVLVPAAAGLCSILFVTAVVIKAGEEAGPAGSGSAALTREGGATVSQAEATADRESAAPRLALPAGESAGAASDKVMAPTESAPSATTAGKPGRQTARDARITLGTDPEGVQKVVNEVVATVDRFRGFVLTSSVTDGPEGQAGARFSLRIPVGSLDRAIAELSGIADLRARSQGLTDVTAPISSAERQMRKARARISVLEAELEQATDPVEQRRLENRIRAQRWSVASARNQLKLLERRSSYAPVAVNVVTPGDDQPDGSSRWGLSDALDDAGHIVATAAGVAVLALAVAIPIGLVVLLAFALNRAWVSRARRRALKNG